VRVDGIAGVSCYEGFVVLNFFSFLANLLVPYGAMDLKIATTISNLEFSSIIVDYVSPDKDVTVQSAMFNNILLRPSISKLG